MRSRARWTASAARPSRSQQVADATTEVRANVGGVSESVTTTGDAAINVVEAAADLTEQARTLRSDIDRFLSEIRAA